MQTTFVRQPSENRNGLNEISTSRATPVRPSVNTVGIGRTCSSQYKARGNGNGDRGLVEALMNSKVFQDYERAFTDASGLPVALRPVESWQLPLHGRPKEGPFCALVAEKSRGCATCLQVQERLSESATEQAC